MVNDKVVLDRYNLAHHQKSIWKGLYSEAAYYTMPERGRYYEDEGAVEYSHGYREDRHLFTSFPGQALEEFADNLSAALTPYQGEWVTLDAAGGPGYDDEPASVKKALNQIQDMAQQAIMRSNYHTEVTQAFLDLGLGTCCIYCGPSREPDIELRFETIPLVELVVEKGYAGMPTGYFRRRRLTIRECKRMWPMHDFSEHTENMKQNNESDPDGVLIEVLESCVEQPIEMKGARYYYSVIDYKYKIVIKGSDKEMSWNPYIIARWSVAPNEAYGRGPAVQCLGDIKQYNKLLEYMFIATHNSINPTVFAANDGVLDPQTTSLEPNKVIPVRSTSNSSPHGVPQVMQRGGDYQLGNLKGEELKAGIGEYFLIEQFGSMENPSKSPEEVHVRHQRFQRRVGSKYPRMISEFMKPLVHNVLEILMGNSIPKELFDAVGRKVVYAVPRSPSEKQRRTQAIQRFTAAVHAISPELLMASVNIPEMLTELAESEGVPPEVMNTKEEIAENLQAAQEAAKKAMEEGGMEQGGAGGQQGGVQRQIAQGPVVGASG